MISCPWQTETPVPGEMDQCQQVGALFVRILQSPPQRIMFDRIALHVLSPALEVAHCLGKKKPSYFSVRGRSQQQLQVTQARSLGRCIRLATDWISKRGCQPGSILLLCALQKIAHSASLGISLRAARGSDVS